MMPKIKARWETIGPFFVNIIMKNYQLYFRLLKKFDRTHSSIKTLIQKIHNDLHKYIKYVNFDSEDYVYKTTGPDFVTNMYINYSDKDNIFILNNGQRQYFGDYAKHNFFGTWK
jgi:hypothetical protein